MKHLLKVIFLILSFTCEGQNQSQQLIEQTAQKIGIPTSDIFSRLTTSHKFENGTLIVIPEIAEKGDGYVTFNSHIVLIDDESGAIKAKFRGEKDWNIDAVSIDNIKIEPKLYQLNESTFGYGLNIFYTGQSKPNPYSGTELSLYAREGIDLKQILKDYPIKSFNGETDTKCRGTFEEHSKKLEILKTYTNQYADLQFTDCIQLSELNEDCDELLKETRQEIKILKFGNGEYRNSM
ncbi:MAG: hypothetical protein ABJ092_15395 [Gillisia sp.]